MDSVTIFPFVMARVTYLILAGENNRYGGISLDEKKKYSRVVTQPRTPLERIRLNTTQQNELICRSFYFITDNFLYEP